ncbi:RTC4-like domain-containing protein [Trametes punicea]|nr:RTC4-like domain-containing protein [Trametes punicea]
METFTRDLKTKGLTLDTDPSTATRLSQRPRSKGIAFEDFGSDFGKRSSRACARDEPSGTQASSSKKTIINLSSDLSDDELDFLSSSSCHSSQSPMKERRQTKKDDKHFKSARPPIAIDYHQTAPGYEPINLRNVRISKKSSAASSTADKPPDLKGDCSAGPGAFSPSTVPLLPRRNADAFSVCEFDGDVGRTASTRKEKGKLVLRERRLHQGRSRPVKSHLPPWDNSDDDEGELETTPRPATCKDPIRRIAKSQTLANMHRPSPEEGDKTKPEKDQSIGRSQSLVDVFNSLGHEQCDEDAPRESKAKAPGTVVVKPRITNKARPNVGGGGKGKQRARDPISAIFGDESPPKRAPRPGQKRQLSAFPMPSPPSSPATSRASSPLSRIQVQGHRMVLSDDGESSEGGRRPIRPFPMEMGLLERLKRVSPAKRAVAGNDLEDAEGSYRKRRRRVSRDKVLDSFALEDEGSDSDLNEFFLDPSVDPATLCPWCDEPLPSDPTPHLVSLIEGARRRSYIDDRPMNPLGLRAPPTVFVSVCQRHRFERVWIPRARKRGWPTTIDWGRLRSRVEKLRGRLKAIIDDVDEDFVPGAQGPAALKGKEFERSRPRKENVFWQEIVRNVRQQGSRHTTGVRGQFLHFNKTQPGYYGELGYVIIHQTLCDLFPPTSFDHLAALPLNPSDFIAHVLVPEAALNLIMEDLSLSLDDSLKTLRDSVEYGVAMFPVDEGENGKGSEDGMVLGAGEEIIMKRAKARRKELQEEEFKEEEEARSAREGLRETDPELDMEIDRDYAPPSSQSKKPKPRPITKRKPSPVKAKAPTTSRVGSKTRLVDSDGETVLSSSDAGNRSHVSRTDAGKRRCNAREKHSSQKSGPPHGHEAAEGLIPPAKAKPRPGAIQRSDMASSSQPDIVSESPWNGVVHSSHVRNEGHPPLSSQSSSSAALGGMQEAHRRQEETADSVNATPRPIQKPTRPNSPDLSESQAAAASGSRIPLQMARERRQQRDVVSVKATHLNGWLPNLCATGGDDPSSTDDEAPLTAGHSSKASRPQRTVSRSSKNSDNKQWDWLLSDGSSSSSRTPSFPNFD